MSLPSKILNKILEIERKIVSYPIENKLKRLKEKYDDKVLNRELLVVDKYGNRYYQHYSNEGIPTRRYMAINFKGFNKWEEDPTMLSWLQFRRETLTQEDLERVYLQQEERERRALEYDNKEKDLLLEYRKIRQKSVEDSKKEVGSIGEGDEFQPSQWNKGKEKKNDDLIEIFEGSLTEIPKWDVLEYENVHGLKGKYMTDFHKENEEWMNSQFEKRTKKLRSLLPLIDMSKYTLDTMNDKYHLSNEKRKEELIETKKEILSLGLKMKERNCRMTTYNRFKSRYSDVFEEYSLNKL